MSRLPQLPGERVVRALRRAGFVVARQRGSHVVMRHSGDASRRCTVLMHGSNPIKPGTLQSILRGAGLTLDEFLALI